MEDRGEDHRRFSVLHLQARPWWLDASFPLQHGLVITAERREVLRLACPLPAWSSDCRTSAGDE